MVGVIGVGVGGVVWGVLVYLGGFDVVMFGGVVDLCMYGWGFSWGVVGSLTGIQVRDGKTALGSVAIHARRGSTPRAKRN